MECGNEVQQVAGRKLKKFCSNECRTRWWNRQRKVEAKIAPREEDAHVCQYCGETFFARGKSAQKYCSHKCYIASRFGDKDTSNNSSSRSGDMLLDSNTYFMGAKEITGAERKEISQEELTSYIENPFINKATVKKD